MVVRCRVQGLVLLCLTTVLVGCSANGLNSVQVTPKVQSLAVGQTAQFSAVGTYGNAKSSFDTEHNQYSDLDLQRSLRSHS